MTFFIRYGITKIDLWGLSIFSLLTANSYLNYFKTVNITKKSDLLMKQVLVLMDKVLKLEEQTILLQKKLATTTATQLGTSNEYNNFIVENLVLVSFSALLILVGINFLKGNNSIYQKVDNLSSKIQGDFGSNLAEIDEVSCFQNATAELQVTQAGMIQQTLQEITDEVILNNEATSKITESFSDCIVDTNMEMGNHIYDFCVKADKILEILSSTS